MISESTREKIYQKILNFISHQARTQKEIEQRLSRYLYKYEISSGEKEEFVIAIINNLEQEGLINDKNYAKNFVDMISMSSKRRGKEYIKRFLAKKGISRGIIDEVTQNIDPENELDSAKSLAQKKLKTIKAKNQQDLKNKLWRALISRGFSPDVIGRAIDSIVGVE